MSSFPDLLVLDLEAAPERRGSSGNQLSSRDLHHPSRSVLGVASCLEVARGGKNVKLTSWEGDETKILSGIDNLLAKHPNHELVTFNGTHFDVPLLRIRAVVNHLFELRSIGSLWERTHRDVIKLFAPPLSLAGCSDLLGLDIDERTLTRRQKCEADVVRTCLVWLHFSALARSDQTHLLSTWRTLAQTLGGTAFPHLQPLFDGLK